MDIPERIFDAILEWTNEGYEYLYDEKPDLMAEVEIFLSHKLIDIETIYRRSDWAPVLHANQGDVLELNRVSSWSFNSEMPNQKYEGINSRMLILSDSVVQGMDVSDISPYKNEEELLLAPCLLYVDRKIKDVLYVKIINKIIEDNAH